MTQTRKTALVTGASTGIGREIAIEFGRRSYATALLARSADGLQRTAELVEAAGGQARVYPTDLRQLESLHQTVEAVRKEQPPVSVVANVAGVWHGDNTVYAGVPLVDTPEWQVLEVLQVGIEAPMLLTRLVLPDMIEQGDGTIINISGTFAGGGAGWLHYYVSKLALEHFTIGLAQELRPHQIRVNCISPSDTATPALQRFFPEDAETALPPEEIARFAAFLVSDDARHITGQIVVMKNQEVD